MAHNTSDVDVMARIQSSDISMRPGLVDNLPFLNGLYTVVVAIMVINAVLFYFQLWRPMVGEEKKQQGDIMGLEFSKAEVGKYQTNKRIMKQVKTLRNMFFLISSS